MAYSDFSLEQLKTQFELEFVENLDIFRETEGYPVAGTFLQGMEANVPLALAIDTEKARSEFIIAPILGECRKILQNSISLFSGVEFNVEPAAGLNGICDFIVSLSSEQFYISAPILALVEAKNDKIKAGVPQCIAEMIAARLFNERKGNPVETVYGIVTTGSLWRFLRLSGKSVCIDTEEYHVRDVRKIFGILLKIVQK